MQVETFETEVAVFAFLNMSARHVGAIITRFSPDTKTRVALNQHIKADHAALGRTLARVAKLERLINWNEVSYPVQIVLRLDKAEVELKID